MVSKMSRGAGRRRKRYNRLLECGGYDIVNCEDWATSKPNSIIS